jgi:predicted Zn-dependent peptidase
VGAPPEVRLDYLVREKFGNWIKRPLMPTDSVVVPNLIGRTIRIVEKAGSQDEALLFLGHSGPPRRTSDYLSLQLANTILGNLEKDSRLEQALAAQDIPHSWVTSQMHFGQICSEFQAAAKVPVASLPEAIQAILAAIENIKTVSIAEPELELAKAKLRADHLARSGSNTQLADLLLEIELFDLVRDFLTGLPARVEQITAERVQEAAKNYLSNTRIATVVVGDGQAIKAVLARLRSAEIVEGGEANVEPTNGK